MNFITNQMGWPSEFTRGYQIAEALGCNVNQVSTSYDETLVAVKCFLHPNVQQDLGKFTNYYADLIDSDNMIDVANEVPTMKMIVLTDIMRDFLAERVSNEIVVISEHHCNFELRERDRDEVKVVGYVGSKQCFDIGFEGLTEALAQIGLEFKYLICEHDNVTRKDICDFYKTIDIQVAYRTEERAVRAPIYRNPLKIFNAGSFRIPTVSYPEIAYRLCAGSYFLEASHVDSLIDKCRLLKEDASLYNFYANRVFEWAKQFDISNIAREYAKLSPNETFNIDENVRRMRSG